MLDRFTDRARRVMSLAKEEALGLKSQKVGTEHLLLALAKEDSGIASEALRDLEITHEDILTQLEEMATTVPAAAPEEKAKSDDADLDEKAAADNDAGKLAFTPSAVSYTHLRAHET